MPGARERSPSKRVLLEDLNSDPRPPLQPPRRVVDVDGVTPDGQRTLRTIHLRLALLQPGQDGPRSPGLQAPLTEEAVGTLELAAAHQLA